MTVLAIESFSGEMPRLAAHRLPPNAAQVTLNCEFASGDVTSVKGLGDLTKRAAGLSNPTGAFFLDDGNFFTWTGNYTVTKATVIDDFHQRIYYTDGSAYLRVIWQHAANQAIFGWSSAVTYAAGAEVNYPQPIYTDYNAGTTYTKGTVVTHTAGTRFLYRCIKSGIVGITPGTDATAWELWGEGIKYRSLQSANTNNPPNTSPTWWIQDGSTLVGQTTRAGVPAPADWTTKIFGAGVYNVQVNASDPDGVLNVYNIPVAVADARAAVDGSTTGVFSSSALIAVARNILQTNVTLKANATAAANTGMAYYASGNVKYDETVVTLFPITVGRLYSFDPPTKAELIGTYEVTQLWIDPGANLNVPTVDLERQGQ